MVGARRAGDVRIAGECVQHHDDVVAFAVQLAPALHRDRYIVEDHTAFQRQGADVDDPELTFCGQSRHVAQYVEDGHRAASHRRDTLAGTGEGLGRGEPPVQVGQDVVDPLDAHREAHQPGRDAGGELLLGGQLLMGGGGRVDDQ